MATPAEEYFFEQLASQLRDRREIIATGYFRTFVRGRRSLGMFAEAARARGYFLALAPDRLLVVQTRAPATSKPLLENEGTLAIPLSSIRRLSLDADVLLIESDVETLSLQLRVSNKFFPSQPRLLEELAGRFNLSETVASVRAAQARKRWLKLGLYALLFTAGLLWALYKNG